MTKPDRRDAVGARLKTIGAVLITMAIVMFMGAPLFRSGSARIVTLSVDQALAPAYRFLLFHANPPEPDGATFGYACALALGAVGFVMTAMGYCWRQGSRQQEFSGTGRPTI